MSDHCINCVHGFGPLFLVCGKKGGEFSGSPVHPQGWCGGYERAGGQSMDEAAGDNFGLTEEDLGEDDE